MSLMSQRKKNKVRDRTDKNYGISKRNDGKGVFRNKRQGG